MSQKTSYKKFVNSILTNLKQTDPEFADVLRKWRYVLDKTVFRLSKISHKPLEDIFQDLLVSLVKTYRIHSSNTYKCEGNIYEVLEKKGSVWHLSSNKLNPKRKKDFWARKDQLKKLKKVCLASSVFKRIQQEAVNQSRMLYSQKRGYDIVGTEKALAVQRTSEVKTFCNKINKNVVQKFVEEVSLNDVDQYGRMYEEVVSTNSFEQVENEFCLKEFFNKNIVSKEAEQVFNEWLRDSSITDIELRKTLNFSKRKLALARVELKNIYREYLGNEVITNKKPVYFKASVA